MTEYEASLGVCEQRSTITMMNGARFTG